MLPDMLPYVALPSSEVQCRNTVMLFLYLVYFCLHVCVCCSASEHDAFLSSQGLLGNKVVLHGGVDLHHTTRKNRILHFLQKEPRFFPLLPSEMCTSQLIRIASFSSQILFHVIAGFACTILPRRPRTL